PAMRSRYTPLRVVAGGLVAFAALFVAAGAAGWWAAADNEQAIGEISRWCERVASGLLREPVNTLGNLGFVFAGTAMFATLARDVANERPRLNRFIGNAPTALLYASAAVFLGPGSMVMHGSHTFFGAWIDNVSMVTFILIPWLVNLSALGRWREGLMFRVYAGVVVGYAIAFWVFGSDLGIGLDLFGVSIGIWVISEVLYRWWSPLMRPLSGLVGFPVAAAFGITPAEMLAHPGDYWWVVFFWLPAILARHAPDGRRSYAPWFWIGIGSFVVAYAIWLTGTADHAWCRPDSLIQAHAIWHLLSALATWSFFVFLRTERPLDVGTPQSVADAPREGSLTRDR
ncbi:MAG: ceramidase domain-containing protein, partial [Acidimicrobiia bacterium]